jgi:nucleotide-binding universal stress UspA family protein
MTFPTKPSPIKRIVLAIDGSPHSLAAMQAAVDLSAGLKAELVAVFVEDLNLLRMAQLPIANEVSRYTASIHRLPPERIRRQLRAQASQARAALARQARRQAVDWEFIVLRGDISLELLAKAEGADLMIMGKAGWSKTRRMGSTTRLVIRQAPSFVLVLQQGVHWARPVLLVYDGSPASERGLDVARELAEQSGHPLSVMTVAQDEAGAARLERAVVAELAGEAEDVSFFRVLAARSEDLARLVESMDCLLVVPANLPGLEGDPLIDFVDGLEGPVMVLR